MKIATNQYSVLQIKSAPWHHHRNFFCYLLDTVIMLYLYDVNNVFQLVLHLQPKLYWCCWPHILLNSKRLMIKSLLLIIDFSVQSAVEVTGQSSRGYTNSWTSQFTDWLISNATSIYSCFCKYCETLEQINTKTQIAYKSLHSVSYFQHIYSYLASTSWLVRDLAVRELVHPWLVQLPRLTLTMCECWH